MTPAVQSAAQWLAITPRAQIAGPVIPTLESRFGLSAMQAIEAIRAAQQIRARAN